MDYYEILGVDRSASAEKIKKAYHEMLKKYHPDNHKENQEWACKRVCEINEAYEILGDPIKKKQYDQLNNSDGDIQNTDENQKKQYGETASNCDSQREFSESAGSGGFPWGILVFVCIIVCALYFLPGQMSNYFENLTNGFEEFLNTFR